MLGWGPVRSNTTGPPEVATLRVAADPGPGLNAPLQPPGRADTRGGSRTRNALASARLLRPLTLPFVHPGAPLIVRAARAAIGVRSAAAMPAQGSGPGDRTRVGGPRCRSCLPPFARPSTAAESPARSGASTWS